MGQNDQRRLRKSPFYGTEDNLRYMRIKNSLGECRGVHERGSWRQLTLLPKNMKKKVERTV